MAEERKGKERKGYSLVSTREPTLKEINAQGERPRPLCCACGPRVTVDFQVYFFLMVLLTAIHLTGGLLAHFSHPLEEDETDTAMATAGFVLGIASTLLVAIATGVYMHRLTKRTTVAYLVPTKDDVVIKTSEATLKTLTRASVTILLVVYTLAFVGLILFAEGTTWTALIGGMVTAVFLLTLWLLGLHQLNTALRIMYYEAQDNNTKVLRELSGGKKTLEIRGDDVNRRKQPPAPKPKYKLPPRPPTRKGRGFDKPATVRGRTRPYHHYRASTKAMLATRRQRRREPVFL